MIATTKPRTVKSQGIQNTVSFGIKESGIAHIFNVLRNQLYSDKVTAVIREYSTNAADAHIEAGNDTRPIEVTLPSRFNLQFKVRDYGAALTDNELQDVYAFYGESTKRNTNAQTGMLGIGSKSVFAYGDNFVINSFIDGKKHTHNAFIDDTQVGQIAKLGVEDTDEENGLEIVVPVKGNDVDEFVSKGQKLFRYFKVKPIVNGKQVEYDEGEVLYEGNGWKWMNQDVNRYDRGTAVAIMGNIGYPIDTNLLKLKDDDSALANFACANLQLECPIGELEISASRESLQYTDFSIKNIIKKLEYAAGEIAGQIAKDFNKCKSLWQAKELAAELFEYNGKLYSVQAFCKKRVLFDGKPLGDTSVSFMHKDSKGYNEFRTDVMLHKYEKSYRGLRKVTGKQERQIPAGGDKTLILNDNSHRRGIIAKMVEQVETENKVPYIVTFAKDVSTAKQKKIIKELGFVDEDFTKLADLPEAQLDGRYSAGGSRSTASVKAGLKVFVYNKDGSSSGFYSAPESSHWDGATIKKDKDFLYLVLDRFQYKTNTGSYQSSRGLCRTIDKLLKHGLMGKHTKVYGIKAAQERKYANNANATILWDFIKETIETEIKKGNIAQEIADVDEVAANLESAWQHIANIGTKAANKDTVFAAFCTQVARVNTLTKKYNDDKDTKVSALRSLAKDLSLSIPKVTPSFKCSLTGALEEHYPMLAHIKNEFGWHYNSGQNGKLKKTIVEYVNLIDETTSPCGS